MLSLILFNLYSKYLTAEPPKWFEVFTTGGHVIHTVKYRLPCATG